MSVNQGESPPSFVVVKVIEEVGKASLLETGGQRSRKGSRASSAVDAVKGLGKTGSIHELGDGNARDLSLGISVAKKAANVDLICLIETELGKVGQCGESIGAVPPGRAPETSLNIIKGIVQLPNGCDGVGDIVCSR